MSLKYTKEQIKDRLDIICDRIEEGESLRSVLKDSDMPSSRTFYDWIDENDKNLKQYTRACSLRADNIFDEILEISDNTIEGVVIETDDNNRTKEKKGDMLGHRKLQIDARKWALSKMNPKKYGDKLDIEGNININKFDVGFGEDKD